ncbi:transcriptional regulator [Actinokineospora sp. PR83]|uniref:transcriptional regulator n=1 Tax=Actinokineospora sp. PR83 TaxID=2884908 RepID=UPI0027DF241C|nr:transcriptional regulator [Actinokineospora sp. PR83]MCG8918495.1 transcriptional regulator [Actinokineospora sp. PR83]
MTGSPPDVTPADHAEDPLLDELRRRLPDVVTGVLRDPFLAGEIAKLLPADRDRVVAETRRKTLAEEADLLRVTNPAISDLRQARRRLAEHKDPWPTGGAVRRGAGYADLGLAFWSGTAGALLFWHVIRLSPLVSADFLLWIGACAAAVVALRVGHRAVARAGRYLLGEPVRDGVAVPFAAGLATAYLLLLWRLGPPSVEALGRLLSVALWVVSGLITLFLIFAAALTVTTPPQGQPRTGLLPKGAFTRGCAAYAVAVALGFPVLSGVITPSWPEWGRVLGVHAITAIVLIAALPAAVRAFTSASANRLRSASGWDTQLRDLARDVDRADAAWLSEVRQAVLSTAARHLTQVVDPPFSTVLPALDRRGLAHMRPLDRVVTTTAFTRLRRMTEGISGGAIGMAGPRGAGKSTLLAAFQAGKFLRPGQQHIALLENVPVRYDAREFVLHLYARLCGEVIRFCDSQVESDRGRWSERLARWRGPAVVVALVLVWLAAGFAAAALGGGNRPSLGAWLASGWLPLVIVLGALSVFAAVVRLPRPAHAGPPPTPVDLRGLRAYARDTLEGIHFQQKHTSGWSGKVGVVFGAEGTRTSSRELTRQPRSYPQITHDFAEFLRLTVECAAAVPTTATPSVVIILDELDKILSPEQAQDFVNEVKALFTLDVPGFLFLVSVSEDALATFERRGLSLRDAFDSAFDVIVRLEFLRLEDTRAILTGRILGLPEPFVCLCHCLSGGLPRELVRVAREVTAEPGDLAEVCARLVAADLHGKVSSLRTVVAHGAHDDTLTADLVRHVDAHTSTEPATLLSAAAHPPIPDGAASPALARLQLEMLGYLYYLATVLEVFGRGFSEHDLNTGRDGRGDASFDTLTSVRQFFPVNARLAWLTISAFRTAWSLPAVPPPGGGTSAAGDQDPV